MAKVDLKFLDAIENGDWIKCKYDEGINNDLILIDLHQDGNESSIYLDKSTSIKFAKTLRTEINKIQD